MCFRWQWFFSPSVCLLLNGLCFSVRRLRWSHSNLFFWNFLWSANGGLACWFGAGLVVRIPKGIPENDSGIGILACTPIRTPNHRAKNQKLTISWCEMLGFLMIQNVLCFTSGIVNALCIIDMGLLVVKRHLRQDYQTMDPCVFVEHWVRSTLSRWWQLKHFLFSPRSLGKWSNLRVAYIFQRGGSTTNSFFLFLLQVTLFGCFYKFRLGKRQEEGSNEKFAKQRWEYAWTKELLVRRNVKR